MKIRIADADGKTLPDEQGYLIKQLMSSKKRWLKDCPEAFIVWLEGLNGFIERQIIHEKENIERQE